MTFDPLLALAVGFSLGLGLGLAVAVRVGRRLARAVEELRGVEALMSDPIALRLRRLDAEIDRINPRGGPPPR